MKRSLLLPGAALIFAALVVAYARASLKETERRVLAAAEAEGRALLSAVSAGVARSIESSRALERILAARLLELARAGADDLLAAPGQEEARLRAFVSRYRLKGALLLDSAFGVVASAAGGPPAPGPRGPASSPVTAGRLTPMVVEEIVRHARDRGLGTAPEVVVGFGESPFSTRTEFIVGIAVPATGGYLLLRWDAEDLAPLREEAGVDRLLVESARNEAITYLALTDAEGTVVAASDPSLAGRAPPPPSPGTFWEVRLPAGEGAGTLVAGLASGPVEEVLVRGRRSTLLFTAFAVVLAVGGAAAFTVLAGRWRRKKEAFTRALAEKERAAALGELAGGVAHEIRSPLNAISMGAQRLARTVPEGEAAAQILAAMRREVARLNRTVEEFLDFGRSRPLEPRPLDLGKLVAEVVAADDPAARVEAPGAPVAVHADVEELRKALGNLVRNARQAAGEGPVIVAFRAAGDIVEIEVRDGGPGVPPADRERIFTPFGSTRIGGTGLGLTIARRAAERHGGRLVVGEAPEGGARFTLNLPAGGPR